MKHIVRENLPCYLSLLLFLQLCLELLDSLFFLRLLHSVLPAFGLDTVGQIRSPGVGFRRLDFAQDVKHDSYTVADFWLFHALPETRPADEDAIGTQSGVGIITWLVSGPCSEPDMFCRK